MAILVLLALFVTPLLVVVGSILWVVPARSTRTEGDRMGPTVQAVQILPTADATLLPTRTAPDAVPTKPPQPTPIPTDNSRSDLGLNPFNNLTIFVILPGTAGLTLLIGAVIVALIAKTWRTDDAQPKDTGINGDNGRQQARMEKLRYGLLTFAFWLALSVFLILDLGLSVSLYFRSVAVYAAFWVLVGALLLWGRPTRERFLILALWVTVLFSVRFVNWTSRKPFLKDFFSIQEGMTPAQVEQIMGHYMKGGGAPLGSPETETDERGEITVGTVTYRHTNEGWGNSYWGVVTFEDGHVVKIEFLPD
jgi:hypothetical protein